MSSFASTHTSNQAPHMTDVSINGNGNHIDEDFAVSAREEGGVVKPRQLTGAAVGAGIAGLVLGGPLLAVVAAGGIAVAATNQGQAGQVVRKSGDVVADAGVSLKRLNRKHQMTGKASKGILNGYQWVSEKLNKNAPNGSSSQPQR